MSKNSLTIKSENITFTSPWRIKLISFATLRHIIFCRIWYHTIKRTIYALTHQIGSRKKRKNNTFPFDKKGCPKGHGKKKIEQFHNYNHKNTHLESHSFFIFINPPTYKQEMDHKTSHFYRARHQHNTKKVPFDDRHAVNKKDGRLRSNGPEI